MLSKLSYRGTGRLWSMGWMIVIRLILYVVIAGFLLQYILFGDRGRIYSPNEALAILFVAFCVTLGILLIGTGSEHPDLLIAVTYVGDLIVLTRIILVSGGFNSVFIPFYLPILVMATALLPRRFTAVFPSIATLGAAYIGLAHLIVSEDEVAMFASLYPEAALAILRETPAHTVVSNMLILTVLFFIVSYLSGIISDKLFLEERLNAGVLSSMKEGLAVVDSKGKVAYANAEFHRLFPEAGDDGRFDRVAEIMFKPEEDGVSLERLLGQTSGNTTVLAREIKGGKRPPVEIRISSLNLRGSNDVFGLVFLVSDLSLRRRMEEAERDVERFSAISTMAAGLAHEIRNPLASLRSAIQEIGESFPDGSEQRVLTDIVISESDRLDGVIGRFLDFSREGKLRPARCRLGAMLESVRTMLQHSDEAAGVDIEVDVRDDPVVLCDTDRLKAVFFNLALNAVQMAPRPGGRLDIVLDRSDKGVNAGVAVDFIDNGPGFDEDSHKHLFEPFFSRKPGGTGMGLSISRKEAELHGGDITAALNPEGGACFRVWLPLKAGRRVRSDTRIIER